MRIAIVEDHPAERELIATMCAEYFNGRNVGATAGRNAMQTVCDVFPRREIVHRKLEEQPLRPAAARLLSQRRDLPHATTGLDIARLLRNQNDDCAIVFITSSTDFRGARLRGAGERLSAQARQSQNLRSHHGTRRGAAEGKTAGHPSGKGAVARHGGFQLACGVR